MMMKRFAVLTALAVAVSLAASGRAQASFDYSTSLTIDSITAPGVIVNTPGTGATGTFGGTTVTLINVSRSGFSVPSLVPNTINIGDVMVTTTTPTTGSDTFTVNYTDIITVTNNPPPGTSATGSFTLKGFLTFTGINTGNGRVTNTYLPPTSAAGLLGGIFFSGSVDNFGSPTINGRNGNFGGTVSAVPEPSSVALMGVGVVAGIGLYARRQLQKRQAA